MTKPLRVGYLSPSNYLDRNTFSGTLYYMYKALNALNIDLIQLGNPKTLSSDWLERVKRKAQKEMDKMFHQVEKENSENLKELEELVYQQLEENPCDVIFAPVCKSLVSRLHVNTPIVSFSDATACLLREGYNVYTEQERYDRAFKEEKETIAKSSLLVY